MKCYICNQEYEDSAVFCSNCRPFVKGSFLEARLELGQALDEFKTALLESEPIKWFISWVTPNRLLAITIILGIILLGFTAYAVIDAFGL